ncbi:MAG TPA: DUF2203 domain-containing protein [Gaiellaceae bacterium]|nr:DUF2203 domain-containing protein [Gaiellaceae bacterium]
MAKMRLFTQAEANRTLADLRPKVEKLVAERRRHASLQDELRAVRAAVGGNGGSIDPARVSDLEASVAEAGADVAALVEEIHRLGVQVKDLDRGLVDFPASHPGGEIVLLCWQLGEPEVAFWHGFEEGFQGRKGLPF